MRVRSYAIVLNEGLPDEFKIGGEILDADHPEMTDDIALNQALGELRFQVELAKPYGELRPKILEWTGDAPTDEQSEIPAPEIN